MFGCVAFAGSSMKSSIKVIHIGPVIWHIPNIFAVKM